MAVEDAQVQSFLFYKVGTAIGISGVIWYFRGTIMHHIYHRMFAWFMNRITDRMNRGLWRKKERLFEVVKDYKEKVNKDLSILEVGAGTATNLKFFPSNTRLTCLDPNPHFAGYIENNLKTTDTVVQAEIVQGFAEKMPLEDNKFDVVVCTLVLCSVTDVSKSLQEIKRVLKPGGIFLCLEHVAAEKNTWTWTFQCIANPFHYYIGDGCLTKRDTELYLKDATFKELQVERFMSKSLPFWLKPCILATASV
ncbi:Methyltransferase-like protein [Mactra antiquata]